MNQKNRVIVAIVAFCAFTSVSQFNVDLIRHAQAKPIKKLSIVGTWKQYSQEGKKNIYLGTFVVAQQNKKYVMGAIEQPTNVDAINTVKLYDVKFDGRTWSFKSKWTDGEVGVFKLRGVSNTIFQGDVFLNNKIIDRNKWIKVG